MKSSLIIILLVLSLTGCSSSPSQPAGATANNINSQNSSVIGKANEQTVRWEAQGMTFTVPADWRKDDEFSKDEEKRNDFFAKSYLAWRSPSGQGIEISAETGEGDFPVSKELMLQMDYQTEEGNKEENKATGTEVSYREVDGMKGILYRRPLEGQKISHNWLAYRHYKGKAQSFMVMLSGKQNEVEKILNSFKISRD